MFVTRATRHDKADLEGFLTNHGLQASLDEGVAFIARDGVIVGCVRLIEVEPGTLLADDVLVDEKRRNEGVGRQVMQTAMNSRGGTIWLSCHEEAEGFYEKLGFGRVDFEDLPAPVLSYLVKVGDHPTPPGHVHIYMKAR
ncbi:MAG: GNAT family N-acetyltransferase [Actinobacteria bacterium]|nr:GNAT family N-acetyltransferase [Actinomycetota bacterium]